MAYPNQMTTILSLLPSISGPYHLAVVLSEGILRLRSTDPSDVLPGILCEKGNEAAKVIQLGMVNSKSFVGKVLLRMKWKFELTYAL